jgi:GNAT superfamily N-acetyltransferase
MMRESTMMDPRESHDGRTAEPQADWRAPMVEVDIARPSDDDARRLLSAYLMELDRRLGDSTRDVDATWDDDPYGGPRARVVVARLDGVAVGCAGLRPHTASAGEVKRLYVAPIARGRGVGRALLAALERAARELGYRRVVLDSAAPLVEAARLYESSGYVRVAPFNDNPRATVWLEKAFPLDDDALWGSFRHATLAHAEWTHRSHVRTGFLHLARWHLDEAHLRMRAGILLLNARHGIEESPGRGYHETMTRAWLALIGLARAGVSHETSEAFLDAHPEMLDRALALRFYSRDLLMSVRARATFVEPDLAPLPAR